MRRKVLIVVASIALLPVAALIAFFIWMGVCDAQDHAKWGSTP